ncbi:kinase-like domain-containing protein [Gigaspora rosea]|uniref:Kinase-like domain-containing protein n=1 Tax=Gigaspora rosea TaxID=44941 RepID=A0A397VKC3_9GLOM|nr:kinase-like domain-containing protein [Gigaspora rosea]
MSDWFTVAVEREYIKSFEYESFENKELIGEGGFGTVYSAYSKDIDQTIALKKLYHCSINDDDSFREFVREIKNITKVNNNSNIILFFGITKDPTTETFYMVLQYANNGDLRSYLRNNFSELDWPTKIKMAKEISSGINCLHNANIVHRDLTICGTYSPIVDSLIDSRAEVFIILIKDNQTKIVNIILMQAGRPES